MAALRITVLFFLVFGMGLLAAPRQVAANSLHQCTAHVETCSTRGLRCPECVIICKKASMSGFSAGASRLALHWSKRCADQISGGFSFPSPETSRAS